MVRYVSTKDEFRKILREAGNKLVVVDFTASWCPPCQRIGPKFAKLSELPENKNVIFLKVDVDEGQELSAEYMIRAMPTFMFFKNGNKVAEFSGADENKLSAMLVNLRS